MNRKSSKLAHLLKRKTIRIMGQPWALERATEQDFGPEDLGRCSTLKYRISVLKGMPDGPATETLIHEILHAAMYASGISSLLYQFRPGLEEEIVLRLSPVLVQILEDNL
jgi:hypothetical protein